MDLFDGRNSPAMSRAQTEYTRQVRKQKSFLNLLFGKQSSSLKQKKSFADLSEKQDIGDMTTRHDSLAGLVITPCPYIRPLEFKMEARVEPFLPKRERLLSVTALEDEDETFQHIAAGKSSQPSTPLGSVAQRSGFRRHEWEADVDISQSIASQRESVAIASALDSIYVPDWCSYIQSYAEGRFSLVAPPQPPPRASDFEYLPAVFPHDEENRILAGSIYDVVWPHWEEEKAGVLVRAAMKQFNTCYAAISFFDGQYENFKAENGYQRRHIPRGVSIAAHALISTDVFVVLDTTKDWRFAGNPLVTGQPKTRFFAGAPMLAPGGEVVGIFALFDKSPRSSFNPFQRRELAEFSQLAMTDLHLQLEWLSDPDVRSTPILQRSSLINADTQPTRCYSPTPSRGIGNVPIDEELYPPALRYHKTTKPPSRNSRLYMSGEDYPVEPTPPSSSGSEAAQFLRTPRGFGKNHKQLSLESKRYTLPRDLITPDSGDFLTLSPRPFGSSGLKSLSPQPANAPNESLRGENRLVLPQLDLTVESFMALTDLDCAEPATENLSSNLVDPNPQPVTQRSGLTSPTSSKKHDSISTCMSGRSGRSNSSSDSTQYMAEAAFSCAFTAQSLGYDLIYAAEIKPARPNMSEEELMQPGGLEVKILVAFGLNKRMELHAGTHLRILRSKGFETIEHVKGYQYQDGEYEIGHLVRMSNDDLPRENRRSGVIFGAFRKPRDELIQVDSPPRRSSEMQKLMAAADALNKILIKNNARDRLEQSLSSPSSPSRYLANEAVEVSH
ncbi:hypothetical protein BP6252_02248 [Coleophoma cylindrospora]|uniref:Uncharacterized protein n=1 Tax=Coleophoma cylindrospora TaxID=1849047 RepID=A0A3D8SFX5_9HELO|nr:hypothetical protein BP6252_02248 [Coleophoma cylindrospora]